MHRVAGGDFAAPFLPHGVGRINRPVGCVAARVALLLLWWCGARATGKTRMPAPS